MSALFYSPTARNLSLYVILCLKRTQTVLSSLADRIILLISGTEGVSYKPNGNGSAIEVKTSFRESISSSAETSERADSRKRTYLVRRLRVA